LGAWRYRVGAHDQQLNIKDASPTVVCQSSDSTL
jgi:hypothetical protein